MPESPFLTIITRHMPARAELLKRNQASLKAQTDPDYEQIVLTDNVPGGGGWGYARQMLIDGSMKARGRYVLVLDDDDMMRAIDGVAMLKAAVGLTPTPLVPQYKIVIFRGWHGVELGTLPRTHWQQAPVQGDIGCFDFILRRDVFRECVLVRGQSDYAHDFDIIAAAYAKYGSTGSPTGGDVVWLDQVICAADKRRMGQ